MFLRVDLNHKISIILNYIKKKDTNKLIEVFYVKFIKALGRDYDKNVRKHKMSNKCLKIRKKEKVFVKLFLMYKSFYYDFQ